MKQKWIILSVNAIYLIGTVVWFIIENTPESCIAILGGFVSLFSFLYGNDKSFLKIKNDNSISLKTKKIGRQINVSGNYTENNNK
ncbi:MAG: hypothetical protein FWD60_13440 [Candidatus Azobacteroides sp.]|nr:hypothetical protein [Candidatus Azobacteroides sp.]